MLGLTAISQHPKDICNYLSPFQEMKIQNPNYHFLLNGYAFHTITKWKLIMSNHCILGTICNEYFQ